MLSRLVVNLPGGGYCRPLTADAPHEIPIMTSADRVDLAFSRRLNRGLQRIAAARGIEAVLLATARAANDLANAAGVCAIPEDQSHCAICSLEDSAVTLLGDDSALQQLVASAAQNTEGIAQYRPLMEIELSPGRRLLAETLFTVPVGADSGYLALAFFWREGGSPTPEQLALLPGLAWTSSLALKSQQDAAELLRSRAEQRSQLMEFQHRARNVLALVRSIIRRSSQAADSPEEFAQHMEGRISALARTQGALVIDGQSGPDLEDLIRTELAANAVRDERVIIAGPTLRLAPRAAETMALALHELTTNALKFGALTGPNGRIAVNWNISPETPSTLHWSWIESNVHIAPTTPQRRGFGKELIERVLPYELGAKTSFRIENEGARCEIDLPINDRTTAHSGRRPL